MKVFGVDGCKSGWFYIGLAAGTGRAALCHGVVSSMAAWAETLCSSDRVFLDIPIGLRDRDDNVRGCDAAARKLLARRASSVFNAPLRDILHESDYVAANAGSRRLCGKGLSKQSFFIMPKIREVDALMRTSERARQVITESHPELCFWGASGGAGLQHGKKTQAGFAERLLLLEALRPGIGGEIDEILCSYPRREVARDDILDAAILALCANRSLALRCAPPQPELDSQGLPMQIVYGYRETTG